MPTAFDYRNSIFAETIGPVRPGDITPGESINYPDDTYGNMNGDGLGINFLSILVWLIFILLLLAGVGAALYYYMNLLKKKDRDEKSAHGVLMEVRVPRGNEIEIGVAEQMFANLYGIGGVGKGIQKYLTVGNSISFEIVGLPGEIRYYMHAPKKLSDLVEKQILGSYQEAEVTISDEYNIFEENSKVAYASLIQTDEPYYPIKVAEDFTGDPMANILSTLSKMDNGEGAMVQIIVSPAGSKWQKNGRKFVQRVEDTNSDPEKKRISVSQEQLQAISKKTSKIGFRTAIRIVTSASSADIANMHLNNIVGAFDQFANPGINEFKKEKLNKLKGKDFMHDVLFRRIPLKSGSILNIEELS